MNNNSCIRHIGATEHRGWFHLNTSAVALAVIMATSGFITLSNAAVLPLSGGDPGEGYSPGPITIYAYDTHGGNTTISTVQGVVFLPYAAGSSPNANISDSGFSQYAGFPYPFSGSPDDNAMAQILHDLWYLSAATGTLTLGGLTPGSEYQVDLLVFSPDSRSASFTFNGGQMNAFNQIGLDVSHPAWDVREFVTANGSGQIIVELTGTGNPVLNGFSVTIPEPSTVMLLGLGGLLMWRRTHHK